MLSPIQPLAVNTLDRIIWTGASGRRYEFEHFAIGQVTWNPVGGVYIFCRQGADRLWYAVYVGETDNFRRRLADEFFSHHQRESITRARATHVSALKVVGSASARLAIETDLRHSLNPPCNRQ